MNHFAPVPSQLGSRVFGALVQVVVGLAFLSLSKPREGTEPWHLITGLGYAMLLSGVYLGLTAVRLAPGIEFDETALRQGRRRLLWKDIESVKLIRLGSVLDFRGKDNRRLMTLAVGTWPQEAIKRIIELSLARLSPPSLPWRDAEGASAITVTTQGLTMDKGIKVEVLPWDQILDVELVKHAEPNSYAILRVRVTGRDGRVLYPGLSRTDQILFYHLLNYYGRSANTNVE